MKLKREQLKCGNCGCKTMHVFHVGPKDGTRFGGGPDVQGQLQLHCTACPVVTIVAPGPPSLMVDDGLDSPGGICGGWS